MREALTILNVPWPPPVFLALAGGLVFGLLLGFACAYCLAYFSGRRPLIHALPVPERKTETGFALKEAEEAREHAEAASEAKSRLLATMSHEIRTPLNGIVGMAELLVATGLDPEQKSYVDAVRTSGAALSALVDEILDFSKIEAGKFELTHAPFDLVSLVEGVTELLAPRAQSKNLEIASVFAPGIHTRVIGDAARLRQVLINLAGNAVKFTDKGGIGLRISAADEMIEFTIIDTGPGIPATEHETIFEEFTMADSQAQPHAGSTGLGLSISRRLVERMNGCLWLAASSEAGSIFTMRLPLPGASDPQPLAAPEALHDKRALIVATSRFEAPYLAETLTAAGVDVLWAASAETGHMFLREAGRAGRPPDIMIVDCALGAEATRLLGESARATGVGQSFVFFSPFERRALGQKPLQAFDGWLVKPLRIRSLYARLAAAPAYAPENAAQALTSTTREDPSLHGLEILLAEDNDINALIVIRHLERRGAHMLRVSDGLAALEMAKQGIQGGRRRFDAMILDIRMPKRDGIEVMRQIREAEQAAGAAPSRLIALSADAFPAAIAAAHAAGADAFLTKPVDLARLDRLLATCHTSDEPAREPATAKAF